MAMTGSEIRESFLKFFEGKAHTRVASSSLVPKDDPTLLFTNAGMVQFKNSFLGLEDRGYRRAVTSQKCVRAGGKHNDLENVGVTARHHTFFEMLGNFSFGDYFKKETIAWAWEYLTVVMGLPKERLWITIYKDDDEAFRIWHDGMGVPAERIVRMGEKSNFWMMGETGPCGPCSEILYDQGEGTGCGRPDCSVECECDRHLEIWNLVFTQFDRDASGTLTPLPKPNIDTGMGLERLAAVIQGVTSNYDSDLFSGIIRFVEKISGRTYGQNAENDVSIRVIADHSRAVTFLIGDGVLPSNEGRGYVLRRILRRAARHGKLLGINRPFLHEVAGVVIDEMKGAYPDLSERAAYIRKVVESEEERFIDTLDAGLRILQEEVAALKETGASIIPGEIVFRLYDTFGFPTDLTADIVRKDGLTLDMEGFEKAMAAQREKARESWKGSGQEAISEVYHRLSVEGIATEFVGYGYTGQVESGLEVTAILKTGAGRGGDRCGGRGGGDRRSDPLLRGDRRPGRRYRRDHERRSGHLQCDGYKAAPRQPHRPCRQAHRREAPEGGYGGSAGVRRGAPGDRGEPLRHPSPPGRPEEGPRGARQAVRLPGRRPASAVRLHPFHTDRGGGTGARRGRGKPDDPGELSRHDQRSSPWPRR